MYSIKLYYNGIITYTIITYNNQKDMIDDINYFINKEYIRKIEIIKG